MMSWQAGRPTQAEMGCKMHADEPRHFYRGSFIPALTPLAPQKSQTHLLRDSGTSDHRPVPLSWSHPVPGLFQKAGSPVPKPWVRTGFQQPLAGVWDIAKLGDNMCVRSPVCLRYKGAVRRFALFLTVHPG